MTWLYLVLLVLAAALVVGAEWPRVAQRVGLVDRPRPRRKKREPHLRVVRSERDAFAESVKRDLDDLPTIEERRPRR